MKRKLNKKGFVLAETLIAAVSVIAIFTLLYNLVYPLLGSYKASENYDDLDSKYIAFYVKEMIETDTVFWNNFNLGMCGGNCRKYDTFKQNLYIDNQPLIHWNDANYTEEGASAHFAYGNDVCLGMQTEGKNNQNMCNKYTSGAGVVRIYIIKYNTTAFKNYVNDHPKDFDRSFADYVKYMPNYVNNSKTSNSNYYRVIVQIEHTSATKAAQKYYSYASIELVKR